MTFKSPSYWCWFAVLALLALILANTPLLNLLAFEFCAVLAFAISFAGAHTAVTGVANLRQRTQLMKGTAAQMVMSTFWRALGINLTLLVAPLIIILLNAFRIINCDFLEGFVFFLLLPVISCAYATALGVFFGLWVKRRWLAYLAYLAYIFATLLALAYNLIFHPPIFGYHCNLRLLPGAHLRRTHRNIRHPTHRSWHNAALGMDFLIACDQHTGDWQAYPIGANPLLAKTVPIQATICRSEPPNSPRCVDNSVWANLPVSRRLGITSDARIY